MGSDYGVLVVVGLFFGVFLLLGLRIGSGIADRIVKAVKEGSVQKVDGTHVMLYENRDEYITQLPLPSGAEFCEHNMELVANETITVPHESRCMIILKCAKCGLIDKTIEKTSPAPKPPNPVVPKSECHHRWRREKAISLTSAFEQMAIAHKAINAYNKNDQGVELDLDKAPPWMFRKACVVTRICERCGEIDHMHASNFEEDNGKGE